MRAPRIEPGTHPVRIHTQREAIEHLRDTTLVRMYTRYEHGWAWSLTKARTILNRVDIWRRENRRMWFIPDHADEGVDKFPRFYVGSYRLPDGRWSNPGLPGVRDRKTQRASAT